MKRNEKLIQKILSNKTRVTIEDCDKLLTTFGYDLRKGSGSHRVYHKRGVVPVTIVIPKNSRYVLSPYISKIIKDLGLEA